MTEKEIVENKVGSILEFIGQQRDWYLTYLYLTDYVVIKIAEYQYTNDEIEDYGDILRARKWCRANIDAMDNGTYDYDAAINTNDN